MVTKEIEASKMARISPISIALLFFLVGSNTCQNDLHETTDAANSSSFSQVCKHETMLKNQSDSNEMSTNETCLNGTASFTPNSSRANFYSHHLSCSKPLDTLNLVYSIYLVIVMVAAFFGNVFVCFVIAKSPKLRNQSVFHLLFSLAVSDILVSILSLPIKLHMGLHNQQFCMDDVKICWFFFLSDILANCSSVTHLLMISVQRFVAMMFPFESHIILSRRRIDLLIGFVWIYAVLWSSLCTFNWSNPKMPSITLAETPTIRTCFNSNPIYWTVLWVAVFIIPLFIMGCLQAAILHSVKSHTRNILRMERDADRVSRMRRREIKVAKTVSIVYAAFTICWLPVCLLTVTASWCNSCFTKFRMENPKVFVVIFLVFTSMLPILSSTLNPFIYVISGDDFRKSIRALFKNKRPRDSRMPLRNASTDHRSSWV